MKFLFKLVSVIILASFLVGFTNQKSHVEVSKGVMLLSISSDGRYVIGNENTQMVLWDVEKQIRTVVSKNANIYSAYFIKNTPYYMYQDLNNMVHVEDVLGNTIQHFQLDFPTYGHVMTSDLQRYYASDVDWRIVKYEQDSEKIIKGLDRPGGFYNGKLLNLTLSHDDTFLLSVGGTSGGAEPTNKKVYIGSEMIRAMKWPHHQSRLTLWDAQTGDALMLTTLLSYKAAGTLSPKGDYIVATDEQGIRHFRYHIPSQQYEFFEAFGAAYLYSDESGMKPGYRGEFDDSAFVKYDPDYRMYGRRGIQVKFITETDYLLFLGYNPYVHIYRLDSPEPLIYESLGEKVLPSTFDWSRNASLDTAPAVHRLVTGKAKEPGIMVYDYDPDTHTLTKIWDSK